MKHLKLKTMNFSADLERSIKILKDHAPSNGPYYGCFSGGKDSVVIKHLAKVAGVDVVWHYHVTTIDPPELVRFIKLEHPEVIRDRPKYGNFFKRAEKKGFPSRVARWCCAEYKEAHVSLGEPMIMGIRGQESPRRAHSWGLVSDRRNRKMINPIFEWESEDLWDYIKAEHIKYCELYDEGFKRLGCVGCPMRNPEKDFERWPRFEKLWRRTFHRIWDRRSGNLQRKGKIWFGNVYFDNADEMFQWWKSKKSLPQKKRDNP